MPQACAEAGSAAPEPGAIARVSNSIEDVSHMYSDVDLRIRLAIKPDESACSGDGCLANQTFDAKVQAIGQRLSQLAYVTYPELKKRTPRFEFAVADKKGIGTASNANGKIVIFRSIQNMDLGDEALAFLLAREMGHVIARHHNSNAATKMLFTVLSGIFFPAVSILSASSAAAQATTATSVLTSTASTVTSYVGSEVALSRIKPSQLTEADDVSLILLQRMGLAKAEIAQSLEFIVEKENGVAWEKDLYQSIHYARKLAGEPKTIAAELEPLPVADSDAGVNAGALSARQNNIEQTQMDLVHVAQPNLPGQ